MLCQSFYVYVDAFGFSDSIHFGLSNMFVTLGIVVVYLILSAVALYLMTNSQHTSMRTGDTSEAP